MKTRIVYDAAAMSRILGLPCECQDPVPQALDGEIVIYYGGWDLKALRMSSAGKKSMSQIQGMIDELPKFWPSQYWYDDYKWSVEAGYYRLLLPVPGSNNMRWSEQLRHLATIDASWQPAPVCVAATSLLVHLTETGNHLLGNSQHFYRCAEVYPVGFQVQLNDYQGCVHLRGCWRNEDSGDNLLLAAARKA